MRGLGVNLYGPTGHVHGLARFSITRSDNANSKPGGLDESKCVIHRVLDTALNLLNFETTITQTNTFMNTASKRVVI